ncbi:MAG TPA: DUF308 domain-containing protein [Myxococcaceae bacterium]|nr:DUF308 domain-containing protein [Myxococcaceae bacterium]
MATTDTPILSGVKKSSAWSIFMGVLISALGILLIAYPFATGAITTVFLGWALIFAGVAEFAHAFGSQTAGNFFVRILLAALYGVAGIMLVAFPLRGLEGLTLLLGALFVVRGVGALVEALRLRPIDGWGWLLADAVFSAAVGVLILAKWPSSGVWAVGTLVGASILVTGIAKIALATTVHTGAARVAQKVG